MIKPVPYGFVLLPNKRMPQANYKSAPTTLISQIYKAKGREREISAVLRQVRKNRKTFSILINTLKRYPVR